ncbi:MAG: glycosyltransferase family 2 protein [Proteobacteria bacterium]|nr:glycosyltransferase family 2 protein [Pseudomonadota bacterium]MBU4127256.1 glycosyltransferase family 2 protein [Pseudomonadota bacterium]
MKNLTLTVIIPTYNRKDILKKCLNALFNQTYPQSNYEIIVIDDGSTDGTEESIKSVVRDSPCLLRYFKQQNKGPAAARNVGITNTSGKIVLFIGDDIMATSTLLEEHYNWHKRHPDDNVAVLGYVTWVPGAKVTLFMEWLEQSGAQFGYSLIRDSADVPYNFFYTSNVSVKRDFLLKYGLFDEDFPYAAWEDIELAYRLSGEGLRIVYNSAAVGYHEHQVCRRSFCKRSRLAGRAMAILHQKHPELKERSASIGRLNFVIGILIWNLPSFMAKLIPREYLYASYSFTISRHVEQGYREWL